MFLRAMAWKELREQRLQALILTTLGVLILAVVFPLFGEDLNLAEMLPVTAVVFAWAGGMVTGAITLANEHETHTQTFLDHLPRRRMQIWSGKLFVALLLVGFQATIMAATSLALTRSGGGRGLDHPAVLLLASLLSGSFGLGCGLLGSALTRTVLAAIGWAVVALFGFGLLVAAGAGVFTLIAESVTHLENGEPLTALAWMLVVPLPSALSALVYSRVDRQRRFELQFQTVSRPRFTPSGFGVRAAFWLSLGQGWPLAVGLAAFALLTSFLYVVVDPLILWPIVTLLIGLLMGVATLGDEQFYGAFKFLADHRLPLGRLWLFKIGSRFLLTVALIGLAALMIAFGNELSRALRDRRLVDGLDFESGIIARQFGAWAIVSVWGLYGFTFGHLAALIARKSVIALAIALPSAIIALAVWIPSFISGALPAWQVLAIPVGVMLLARTLVWAWATDRLLSRRSVVKWCASVALFLGFLVACAAYRVYEVPLAAPPEGIAEFEASYPPREENPVRAKIIQAEDRVRTDREFVSRLLQLTLDNTNAADRGRGRHGGDRVALTLALGWPKDDVVEWRMASESAKTDWLTPLLEATTLPTLPVDIPRDEPLLQRSISVRARDFGPWMAFRALEAQARGRHVEALDILAADLVLARNLMTKATRTAWQTGLTVEGAALYGLERWGEHADLPPNLLPKALKLLQRHESERPVYADMLRAEYLRLREFQRGSASQFDRRDIQNVQWKRVLIQSAVTAPWEKARRARLMYGHYELLAQAAELDYETLRTRFRQWQEHNNGAELAVLGAVAPDDPETNERAARLHRLMSNDVTFGHFLFYFGGLNDAARFVGLCQTRALQLRFALQMYQGQHAGVPAKNLAELVPSILPAVPIDPYYGFPFRYRVIDGDEVVSWREDVRPDSEPAWVVDDATLPFASPGPHFRPVKLGDESATHRRLHHGTGLIWSVGPDGVDHGGKSQYPFASAGSSIGPQFATGTDMLFPVPPPSRAK